jgi:hypothetical protein
MIKHTRMKGRAILTISLIPLHDPNHLYCRAVIVLRRDSRYVFEILRSQHSRCAVELMPSDVGVILQAMG